MRFFDAILCACLATLWVGGQQPVPQQQTGSVEGLVLKAATGEPIKKARVFLRPVQRRAQGSLAVTDSTGRFLFSDVPAGTYRLRVERNGYVEQEYGERRPGAPGTPVSLRPGQRLRDVAFWLIPSAVITGRIVDEDGEPVPYVRVQVLRYQYSEGERTLTPVNGGQTNDLGEYRIFGLAPGQYYVTATAVGGGIRRLVAEVQVRRGAGAPRRAGRGSLGEINPDEGYAPTYYPGTVDPARAVPLRLLAGDELRGIDFSLNPVPTVRVRGRVLAEVGDPNERGIQVMLIPRSAAGFRFFGGRNSTVADPADGTFELAGVVPGQYTLAAFVAGDGRRYFGQVPLDAGAADVEGVTVSITAGVNLSVRVAQEGGSLAPPVSTADVSGEEPSEVTSALVVLLPSTGIPFGRTSEAVKIGENALLENVPKDVYRVTLARLPQDYYVKSARLSGRDVLNEGLDLSLGAPSDPLEIVISGAGAQAGGVVLDSDDKPFAGAIIALVPEENRRHRTELFKTTTADQNGQFVLRGIAPGDYRLFAWEEIEPGAHQDPDFLRLFERDGVSVEFREGERKTVELELIPAARTRMQ